MPIRASQSPRGHLAHRSRFVDTASRWHLGAGFAVATIGLLSWLFGSNGYVSAFAVVLSNLYLVSILIEASIRAQQERKVVDGVPQPKPACFMEFPEPTWSLLQVQFLLIVVLCGFATMYIRSGDIRYQGPAAIVKQTDREADRSSPAKADPSQLVDRVDALYYSAITFSTVGYGDFVPTSSRGRILVLWHLATGMLLVLGVFPLIVGRISDF